MADIWTILIPVYILLGLLLLLVALNLLARVQGGRYVRPIGQAMMKVPFLKNYLQKASRASLEKQNPELASAMAKLERSGVQNDCTAQGSYVLPNQVARNCRVNGSFVVRTSSGVPSSTIRPSLMTAIRSAM